MTTDPATIAAPAEPHASPPITVILTTILLIIFFIGFFTIYFCRCFMQNVIYNWNARHNPPEIHTDRGPGSSGPPGLDPVTISHFPTFLYSNVKEFRHETHGLECAICLSEFEDDNVIRLLPKCYHVFHQECIDLWLESHKSCPFCRRLLVPSPMSPWKSPLSQHSSSMHNIRENELLEDTFTVNIRDETERSNNGNANTKEEGNCKERNVQIESVNGEEDTEEEEARRKEKFSRSNSTGHSISKNGKATEDEDRFTLRLPEHIQAKLIHGHNWTRSCTEIGKIKTRTSTSSTRFGEASTSADVNKD